MALAFPAFNDGRSFSKAELLRSRYGFTGAVRAVGQVLVDQLPHMLRLGFSEFEVTNPTLICAAGGRSDRRAAGLLSTDRQAGCPRRQICVAPQAGGVSAKRNATETAYR